MKFEVEIIAEYSTSKFAKSIAKALDVDNLSLENLYIKTCNENNKVVSKVVAKKLKTFVATVDDLLLCKKVAEGVLNG